MCVGVRVRGCYLLAASQVHQVKLPRQLGLCLYIFLLDID